MKGLCNLIQHSRSQFLVSHIHCLLKKGNYAQCVGTGAPIYLTAKILKLAGNATCDNKKHHIITVIYNLLSDMMKNLGDSR